MFAWAGAALFLASLLYFFFCYLILFDREATLSARAVTWNVALFTIFALHHSVFARTGIRLWVARTFADLERSIYVWVACILFAALLVGRLLGAFLFPF